MLRSLKPLLGYRLHATDGPAGILHDFWFDDVSWSIRHVVAHVGHRLTGHNVLLDPSAIREIDWVHKTVILGLTRDVELHSPPEETHLPLYRQFRDQSLNFSEWATHWPPFSGVPEPNPQVVVTGDAHLRSVRHLSGYRLYGHGEKIGHLVGYIADDAKWHIPLLIAGTGHFWDEKQVLLPSDAIHAFVWEERTLQTDLDAALVKNAPAFNPLSLSDPQILNEVHDHFMASVHST